MMNVELRIEYELSLRVISRNEKLYREVYKLKTDK